MAVEDFPFHHPITKLVIDTSATDTELVAAAGANKIIRVVFVTFIVAGAVTVTFQSHTTTNITGSMQLPANGGIALGYCPYGYFETVANEKLNLELSSGVSCDGFLGYQVIDTGIV